MPHPASLMQEILLILKILRTGHIFLAMMRGHMNPALPRKYLTAAGRIT